MHRHGLEFQPGYRGLFSTTEGRRVEVAAFHRPATTPTQRMNLAMRRGHLPTARDMSGTGDMAFEWKIFLDGAYLGLVAHRPDMGSRPAFAAKSVAGHPMFATLIEAVEFALRIRLGEEIPLTGENPRRLSRPGGP